MQFVQLDADDVITSVIDVYRHDGRPAAVPAGLTPLEADGLRVGEQVLVRGAKGKLSGQIRDLTDEERKNRAVPPRTYTQDELDAAVAAERTKHVR